MIAIRLSGRASIWRSSTRLTIEADGGALRLLYVGFGTVEWTWRPLIYGVAIASMIVGSVLGLTQTDLKRMLAYSSIAHAGFLLTGVLGLGEGGEGSGLAATMFYLLTYGITTLGVFAAFCGWLSAL